MMSNGISKRSMRKIAKAIAIPALAVALMGATGCSILNSFMPTSAPTRDASTGEITEGNATADAFAIRVGDCFDGEDLSEDIYSVPVVPCGEPHGDEVIHAFDMQGSEAPDDAAVDAAFEAECIPAFESFVGIAWEESTIDMWPMFPSTGSWAEGDREMLCIVYDPAGKVTGTLKGAAR